jgi:hypothetical protein
MRMNRGSSVEARRRERERETPHLAYFVGAVDWEHNYAALII